VARDARSVPAARSAIAKNENCSPNYLDAAVIRVLDVEQENEQDRQARDTKPIRMLRMLSPIQVATFSPTRDELAQLAQLGAVPAPPKRLRPGRVEVLAARGVVTARQTVAQDATDTDVRAAWAAILRSLDWSSQR
jgi:hypothetical protein